MQAPASAYTGPYASTPSTQANLQNGSRPTSAHAFSSPHPHSPTNLPPPLPAQTYTFVNGNGQSAKGSPAPVHHTPSYPPMQATPSQPYQGANGSRPTTSDGGQRRNSVHLPSPLASAPILTPSNKQYTGPSFAGSSPMGHISGHAQPTTSSSPPDFPQDSVHNPLPPAATGSSPTKHATPRAESNGNLSSPKMLPPVTSLLPSPSLQNLTPPVKPSGGEWNEPVSQQSTQ